MGEEFENFILETVVYFLIKSRLDEELVLLRESLFLP